jgi:hypothetical protein
VRRGSPARSCQFSQKTIGTDGPCNYGADSVERTVSQAGIGVEDVVPCASVVRRRRLESSGCWRLSVDGSKESQAEPVDLVFKVGIRGPRQHVLQNHRSPPPDDLSWTLARRCSRMKAGDRSTARVTRVSSSARGRLESMAVAPLVGPKRASLRITWQCQILHRMCAPKPQKPFDHADRPGPHPPHFASSQGHWISAGSVATAMARCPKRYNDRRNCISGALA